MGLNKQRQVVVTGIGVISSIGIGKRNFSDAIKEGKCGADNLDIIDSTNFETHIGCEVKNFHPKEWIFNLNAEEIGRASQFAIAASKLAIEDASMNTDVLKHHKLLVCIGTTEGEALSLNLFSEYWVKRGINNMPISLCANLSADKLSINVLKELNLIGEPISISTACAAGNYAIGYAYDLVANGNVDFALCGGAESISRKAFAGFTRLGTIAPKLCQPFDKNRKGILTGEGAGILLIETLESALKRNAPIYAEIIGYGLNCDATHPVAPNQQRIEECMKKAHKRAGIIPSDISYISAHGTGTIANDMTEIAAIKNVFGEHTPPVSSLKSLLGHAMGAASALSCISCILGIYESFLPPTINYITPDDKCQIDCVPNQYRKHDIFIAQNNAFAFGGNNAILLLKKYNP